MRFSFNRWLDETSLYLNVDGSYPFFSATGLDKLIQKVVKVDEMTVDIVLNNADSSFANLATDFAIVLSAEYAQLLSVKDMPYLIDKNPQALALPL